MADTLTRQVTSLVVIPLDPVELTSIDILEHSESPSGARLYASSLSDSELTVPTTLFHDQPFDMYLVPFSESSISMGPASAAAVDRAVSANMIVTLGLHFNATEEVITISTRISGNVFDSRLRIRVLQLPTLWAAVDHISLHEIRFAETVKWAGKLPANVRVGCNHSVAPECEVYAAAVSGNVAALWAALADGGSTEEANDVSGLDPFKEVSGMLPGHTLYHPPCSRRSKTQL